MKRFFYLLSTVVLALSIQSSALAQTSLNDVTFLLPLPRNLIELKTNFLNASTVLSSGALVSSNRLKLFDFGTVSSDLDLTQRANIDRLAVLGIRLDPCFKDHFTDACRPQIRLVMQPVTFAAGISGTADLGVHLFYDVAQDKILELIRFARDYRIQFLGPGSFKAPLQIQPVIQQESITGKFWQGIRPMIQSVLNQSVPTRIAFFVVEPSGRQWTFRSFDLNGMASTPVQIAGISTAIERIDNEVQNSTHEFEASSGLLPRASVSSDQTFDFLNDSKSFQQGGFSRLNPLMNSLERIENPKTHLPGTVDCLSCHSTPSIKADLRNNHLPVPQTIATFIGSTLPQSSLINLFEQNYDSRDFRLFGYRDGNPIVGQRVINESAAVVDSVSNRKALLFSKQGRFVHDSR